MKWESGLNDEKIALNFVKPLACQKTNSLPCNKKLYDDKDIEELINMLKQEKNMPERNRKIPSRANSSQRLIDDKVSFKSCDKPTTSKHFVNTPVNNSLRKHVSLSEQYTSQMQTNTCTQFLSNQNLNKFVQRTCSKSTNNDSNIKSKNLYEASKSQLTASSQSSNGNAETQRTVSGSFKTARDELYIQEIKNKSTAKKTLGGRVAVNSQFICPVRQNKERSSQNYNIREQSEASVHEVEDERLKNIDSNMIELIRNEIMDSGKSITWKDIAGLEYTKKIIKEVVVFPILRPDIFTGLRRPPKGILLFGPPGTGKTLIGKCIASQSKSTFFSISASSLTSKWIGEGEKMVRALFAVARVHQPSVVFIDEIDSLLTQRSETEHESSRRIKTEFLVQLDGAATSEDDRILIVGATNRPQELDEAARRRLVKRLYVPLPEHEARKQIINNLLASVQHNLSQEEITKIAEKSVGYSGADMTNLCKEASMEPIRSIPFNQLEDIKMEEVRHITSDDFEKALINVRPSISQSDLNIYIEWDRTYGSGTAQYHKE